MVASLYYEETVLLQVCEIISKISGVTQRVSDPRGYLWPATWVVSLVVGQTRQLPPKTDSVLSSAAIAEALFLVHLYSSDIDICQDLSTGATEK